MINIKDKKGTIKAFVRIIRDILHETQCRPMPLAKFIYYNFMCRNVKTDWRNNGFLIPTPYSVIEIQKGAVLELHGPFIIGNKKHRKSHVESRLLLEQNSYMSVNRYCRFGTGSNIEVFPNAELLIDQCGSNVGCTIICGKRIELRGHVSIGRDVSIRDTNAHIIAIDGYKVLRPVVIENHTWLCSGSTISPGVKIKEGAVVGAMSYVIQNVPAHTLVSGHPAKVVYKDIAWKL